MSRELEIRDRLQAIEQALHDGGLWQACAPNAEAFESKEPFCVDTMMPVQWLQWVFLPRMTALLDAQADLPVKLAIAPYYEVALEGAMPGRAKLLHVLNQLDQFFEHDN
ncbi:YqcC family protein [Erwinia sp. BNK-24-b]|uniref:YqcC family protein n=1 Tax=Erwinia TaxID=551 RepID=UPI001FED6D65|nr:YqcC family protein [Erwinia phyllosphaerae]MBV4368833.1 YqcC family protein [Erwinia phyllosphaerae]